MKGIHKRSLSERVAEYRRRGEEIKARAKLHRKKTGESAGDCDAAELKCGELLASGRQRGVEPSAKMTAAAPVKSLGISKSDILEERERRGERLPDGSFKRTDDSLMHKGEALYYQIKCSACGVEIYAKKGISYFCKDCRRVYASITRQQFQEKHGISRAQIRYDDDREFHLIRNYKNIDKKKGQFTDDLDYFSRAQADRFLLKPCHYCGTLEGIGLDRIDNSRGHQRDNVVPACGRCNKMRGHLVSYEEMLVVGKALKDFRMKSKENGDASKNER